MSLTLCANRSCWRFRPAPNLEKELEEIPDARETDVRVRCMVAVYQKHRMRGLAVTEDKRAAISVEKVVDKCFERALSKNFDDH